MRQLPEALTDAFLNDALVHAYYKTPTDHPMTLEDLVKAMAERHAVLTAKMVRLLKYTTIPPMMGASYQEFIPGNKDA